MRLALLALPLLLSTSLAQADDPAPKKPIQLDLPAPQVTATHLAEAWAKATGRRALVGPQASQVRVRVGQERSFSPERLHALCAHHDLVAVEDERSLAIYTLRSLASRQLPPPVLVKGAAALPALNRPTTLVWEVQHGGASAIFANLRGVMSRDPSRFGNVLYVQGPEKILVTELAGRLKTYQDLLAVLDRPGPAQVTGTTLALYELSAARWSALQRKSPLVLAAALEKLVGEKQATSLESARVVLSTGLNLHKTLRQGSVTMHVGVSLGEKELNVELQRIETGNEVSRLLSMARSSLDRPVAVSVSLASGSAPTQLVAVLIPIKEQAPAKPGPEQR
ncbi:MAG TPA: hypothetical protein DEA08_29800 [Planctomycetes bacterium]|nr:hypothetical protein [Planctomycetota bacterium]